VANRYWHLPVYFVPRCVLEVPQGQGADGQGTEGQPQQQQQEEQQAAGQAGG